MVDRFEVVEDGRSGARIKVIGVGGAGGNALNNMVEHGLSGVEFVAINTDVQALAQCKDGVRTLQIGERVTGGLGAGNDPDKGKRAAEESESDLIELLSDGTNMVFITAGLGGGTGTGASPVIARIAKEMGILTVAVVTKPFSWEMKNRKMNAERGLEELREHVDAMIVIQNDRVLVDKTIRLIDAFKKIDDVLRQGVQSITDIINVPGYINADFNDVKSVMENRGMALMAIAESSGENRSEEVVKSAIDNPLVECSGIRGAKGILYNITSGYDFSLGEFETIGNLIKEEVGEEASLIFGWVTDERMEGRVRLTIIATGFEENGNGVRPARKRFDPEVRERIFRESIEASRMRGLLGVDSGAEEVVNTTIPGVLKNFLQGT